MSTEFWILLGVLIVGFILTWIICSKPVSESDWKDLDSKPGAFYPMEDMEKVTLRIEKSALERKVYTLERELYYRRYERPMEVNIENIVKVDVEKTN